MNIEEIRRIHDIIHADMNEVFIATVDIPNKLTKGVPYRVTGMAFGYATIEDDSGNRMRLEHENAWLFEKA